MKAYVSRRKWNFLLFVSLTGLIMAAVILVLGWFQGEAFASQNNSVFGPACGEPTINGEVDALEWENAYSMTFSMVSSGDPLTGTLYVMNGASNLYLGFTINDDELTLAGLYMGEGDYLRIDFDNDNGGSLFTIDDDVLSVYAAPPHFYDAYIWQTSSSSTRDDSFGGGGTHGIGVMGRIGDLNHMELKHPICSGDSKDFCLTPGQRVGFRLEYLDTEGYVNPPVSYFFPGSTFEDTAEWEIGSCGDFLDIHNYLPLILR